MGLTAQHHSRRLEYTSNKQRNISPHTDMVTLYQWQGNIYVLFDMYFNIFVMYDAVVNWTV